MELSLIILILLMIIVFLPVFIVCVVELWRQSFYYLNQVFRKTKNDRII